MTDPNRIRRFVGVYDADGTALGELTYFVRARLGRAHCSLCDITHGRVRERDDWRACRSSLSVPFDAYHRDDQPAAVRALGRPPLVAAEHDDGSYSVVLDADALASCAGSPERLVALLDAAT